MSGNEKICYGCMQTVQGDICTCGWHYNYTKEESITLLPPGTLIGNGQYRIGRKLGQGGFGITYLAARQDMLGIRVAVKEYFPRKLVHRNIATSNEVYPNNPPGMSEKDARDINTRFEIGKHKFIEEARRLAGFNELSSIVSVLGYVEENNTAYIIMEYVDGIDLQRYMQNLGRTLTLSEVRKYILPIIEDLDQVHKFGIIHRDISPDNIMITKNGHTKLIDFGAAVSQEGEDIRVMRKNGFAPPEQYETRADELGPWTDVYAMCVTIFMLLTGIILPDSRKRTTSELTPGFKELQLCLPKKLEKILKKGLMQDFKKRCQSMNDLARQIRHVRDFRKPINILQATVIFFAGVTAIGLCTFHLSNARVLPSYKTMHYKNSLLNNKQDQEILQTDSASDYAVYDDLVYIRYDFGDGLVMLARSKVGADDIADVQYVTDGPIGNFCVKDEYLYVVSSEDRCMYRVNLSGDSKWEKISNKKVDENFTYSLIDGNVYALYQNNDGTYEIQKISIDGSSQEMTCLKLNLKLCKFYGDYVFMTTEEGEETILSRMRLDGTYYEELGRYHGNIPAMIIEDGKIYYLFNSVDKEIASYVGCMEINGINNQALVQLNSENLEYCYMTGIVDNNNIYYTCSDSGKELLNNLYCYSISEKSNRQISSECGRYIATSDDINCIVFASSDGKEIRQMNKDGSNPRVMKEADGSAGIQDKIDITSLEIIKDHVYYLDGGNVAYKQIKEEEI